MIAIGHAEYERVNVGGAVGVEQISEMWYHHFPDKLNNVHNMDTKSFVSEHSDGVLPKAAISISAGIPKETKLGTSGWHDV